MSEEVIGVPTNGAFGEPALDYLEENGYGRPDLESDRVVQESEGTYFFVGRPQDFPAEYFDRNMNAAITGKDLVMEELASGVEQKAVWKVIGRELEFGEAELWLMAPEEPEEPLKGASSYPNLADQYFAYKGVEADFDRKLGSVEGFASQDYKGDYNCVVDVVVSGDTRKANDLEKIEKIMDSSAFLLGYPRKIATFRNRLNPSEVLDL